MRLLKREGWVINHKRVLRMMREDNLLSIRRRRFAVTTDSDHRHHIYPNLARSLVVNVGKISEGGVGGQRPLLSQCCLYVNLVRSAGLAGPGRAADLRRNVGAAQSKSILGLVLLRRPMVKSGCRGLSSQTVLPHPCGPSLPRAVTFCFRSE